MDAKQPSWVGFFDILGFKDMVQSQDLGHVASLLEDIHDACNGLGVESVAFSDSILLYTLGDEVESLERLLKAAIRLLGPYASIGVAVRGGIAVGEFYCKNQVFLGKAMIRAYEIAEAQDWMGAIIDPTEALDNGFVQRMQAQGILVEYPAPIKGGPVGPVFCLGWPRHYPSEVSPLATSRSKSWDVLRKDANTQNFLSWYKRNDLWTRLGPLSADE